MDARLLCVEDRAIARALESEGRRPSDSTYRAGLDPLDWDLTFQPPFAPSS